MPMLQQRSTRRPSTAPTTPANGITPAPSNSMQPGTTVHLGNSSDPLGCVQIGDVAMAQCGIQVGERSNSAMAAVLRHARGGTLRLDAPGLAFVGRDGGQALPPAVRARMERAFGVDFAAVRIHTSGAAGTAAQALAADAFTTGRDVYFSPGRWAPGTTSGDRLLAHELAHVVQNAQGRGLAAGAMSAPGDTLELEAERLAGEVTRVAASTSLNLAAAFGGVNTVDVSGGLHPPAPASLAPGGDAGRSGVSVAGLGATGIQRFASREHIALGDAACSETLAWAGGTVTFGEATALAGDYFESPDALASALGASTGEGAEPQLVAALDRIREEATGADPPGPDPTPGGTSSMEADYYRLAGDNDEHFPESTATDGDHRNAHASYADWHAAALAAAERGDRTGALAAEAFAIHFYSDASSSGHLAVDRGGLRERLAVFSDFGLEISAWLATQFAAQMVQRSLYGEKARSSARTLMLQALEKRGLTTMGLDDILAGAAHDSFNATGVDVVVEGETEHYLGDDHLDPDGAQFANITKGASTSVAEVLDVLAAGGATSCVEPPAFPDLPAEQWGEDMRRMGVGQLLASPRGEAMVNDAAAIYAADLRDQAPALAEENDAWFIDQSTIEASLVAVATIVERDLLSFTVAYVAKRNRGDGPSGSFNNLA